MNYRFVDRSLAAASISALWLIMLPAIAFAQATDMTATSPTPVATPESVAQNWGLTATELIRSQRLLYLHRGLIHEDITPLEALGIFSATAEDRRRYATLYAQKQMAVLNRISEFEEAVLQAMRELNPHENAGLAARYQLTVDVGCSTVDCRTLIRRALAVAGDAGLDIHLMGTGGQDTVVRRWAAINGIPPDAVRDRTITLNHGADGMKEGLSR